MVQRDVRRARRFLALSYSRFIEKQVNKYEYDKIKCLNFILNAKIETIVERPHNKMINKPYNEILKMFNKYFYEGVKYELECVKAFERDKQAHEIMEKLLIKLKKKREKIDEKFS